MGKVGGQIADRHLPRRSEAGKDYALGRCLNKLSAGCKMLTTSLAFRQITADIERSLERVSAIPQTGRETEYYRENIENIRSIDDFMGDERLYSYAMTAFGLDEMRYAKAFIRKVLEEGIDQPDSLANRLADRRYRDLAEAFNFTRYGETTSTFRRVREDTVQRYLRQVLEVDAGQQNEGVRLALYFARKAEGIGSAMDILADPALLKVVQIATGISPLTGAANVDRQAEMIAARLDIDDLQDPKKLDAFLTRFTSLWELENGPAMNVPAIMAGPARPFGLSADLLASLQRVKFGGV